MENILYREFPGLDEAMAALPKSESEHLKRSADYMEIIFLQACNAELYMRDQKAVARLKEEYVDLARDIALYHDIGKAFVPGEYHRMRDDLSIEEIALYQKHTTDSIKLVDEYLNKDKKYNSHQMNYIREAIECHHEKWDGSGFPNGTKEENTPILARMLAVVDALDRYSSEKRSEQPFEYALSMLEAGSGMDYDPEIVKAVKLTKTKLKKIFNLNIENTRAIPVTEPFIKRTSGRPFKLVYRPVAKRKGGETMGYEAKIVFKNKQEFIEYPEVADIIKNEKMATELGIYMMLEACDTLTRFDLCEIKAQFILLSLPEGFFTKKDAYKEVLSVLEDTRISPERLYFAITDSDLSSLSAAMSENFAKIKEAGCTVLGDNLSLDNISNEDLKTISFGAYRLGASYAEKLTDAALCERLKDISDSGIVLFADGIEKKSQQTALNRMGVIYSTGLSVGDFENEDLIVETEIASQEAK